MTPRRLGGVKEETVIPDQGGRMLRGTAVAALVALVAAMGSDASSSVRCLRAALPLGRNAIAPATEAALKATSKRGDPQVVGARLAGRDSERGPIARTWCGKRAQDRTVVVYIDLRAYHPSASLSQRVLFVSRFANGYRVWAVPHSQASRFPGASDRQQRLARAGVEKPDACRVHCQP